MIKKIETVKHKDWCTATFEIETVRKTFIFAYCITYNSALSSSTDVDITTTPEIVKGGCGQKSAVGEDAWTR